MITTLRIARANAGTLNHAVPKGTRVALCGFEPKVRRNSNVQSGWYTILNRTFVVTCPDCKKKMEKMHV